MSDTDPRSGSRVTEQQGLRQRIAGQAEDTIGRIADDLLENPVINSAISRTFTAREKMAQAQQSAMDALNLPTASELDKLARRLRDLSRRLERIEDSVDAISTRLQTLGDEARAGSSLSEQVGRMEVRLEQLGRDVGALRRDIVREGVPGEPPAIVPEG
jgi:CRP-like cAMP-binding protein